MQNTPHQRAITLNAQNNNLHVRPVLQDLLRGIQASEDRRGGIHNYNIWRFFVCHRQKINFCGRFPDDSPAFLIAKSLILRRQCW